MARNFPDWIAAYLDYTQFSEAPSKFHFWTAVSVIGGALRRRVWIEQGYFQWVPNFYIIFVSPPGIVSKSTTADIGMSLLRQVPGIKFGPNSLTWQSFTQSLAEATEGIEMPDGEIYPMSAMTVVSSELGSLLNFEDREMVDVFVDLWDGKKGLWHRKTKTSGEDKIQNPYVNIIGCTTPAWMRRNFERYLLGQGFTSRCIFVYGNEKRHLEAYPGERIAAIGSEFQQKQLKLVQDLEQIGLLLGGFRLTPEATAWGRVWYEKHYARYKAADPNDEGLTSFLARKQTQIHKLGIVLSAAKRDQLIITPVELQMADQMMNAAEGDLPEIFGRMAERDEVADAVILVQVIAQRKALTREALYRLVFNRMSARQYEDALMSVIAAGRAKLVQRGTTIMVELIPDNKDSNGQAPDPIPK